MVYKRTRPSERDTPARSEEQGDNVRQRSPADRPPRGISPDQIARFSDILLHYPSLLDKVQDLEAQLKQARDLAISEKVQGCARHLVTLTNDSRPESEIASAWEELFPMMITLLQANKLDHLLEVPQLAADDLEQARLDWADGIRRWRETEGLAQVQLLAAPCDHSLLSRWLSSSGPQTYAAAYSPETVHLLTAVLRTRAARQEASLDQIASSLTSGLYIADPLVSDTPIADSPSDTAAGIAGWCATIATALQFGARRVLGCAALPIPISQASAGYQPGPWLAFDICTARQDIRVYRCGGKISETDIQSDFGSVLRLAGIDQEELWEIKVEDPLRSLKLEFLQNLDHSGPLAVEILNTLVPMNSEDVLTRAMDGVPAAADEGEIEAMKLAQHLSLLKSNACNRQLLELCTAGTIRLYR